MFKLYREIVPDEFLCIGYDMAMGGLDYSAIVFFSKTRQDVPLIYHSRETATIATNKLLPMLPELYKRTQIKPLLAPERNSGGVLEIDRMLNSPYANYFRMYREKARGFIDTPDSSRYGWNTNVATRSKMLEELKTVIDNKLIGIYDKEIVNELYSFVINQTISGWKAQAERGAHDDLVMALAIAYQISKEEGGDENMTKSYIPQNNFNKWRIGK
jgi:hypothetical protein